MLRVDESLRVYGQRLSILYRGADLHADRATERYDHPGPGPNSRASDCLAVKVLRHLKVDAYRLWLN